MNSPIVEARTLYELKALKPILSMDSETKTAPYGPFLFLVCMEPYLLRLGSPGLVDGSHDRLGILEQRPHQPHRKPS